MTEERIREIARAFRIERGYSQASQADLDYLHQKTGLQHGPLDALLSELNGSNFEEVLPEFDFLNNAREIADRWFMHFEGAKNTWGEEEVSQADRRLAGSPAPCWSRYFLPLTNDGAGDGWILDLRAGPQHGVILDWYTEIGVMPDSREFYTGILQLLGDLGDYSD